MNRQVLIEAVHAAVIKLLALAALHEVIVNLRREYVAIEAVLLFKGKHVGVVVIVGGGHGVVVGAAECLIRRHERTSLLSKGYITAIAVEETRRDMKG